MKLNTGAMLKAIGIGLVIELVMFGVSQAVTLASGVTPAAAPEEILSSGAVGIGLCLSCVGLLLYGVMGAIYGWFAHRDQGTVDVGQTALGGGITAVIVSVIGTVGSTLYSLATGELLQTIEQASGQVGDDSGVVMASVVGGIVIGFCIAFVLSAGLGAAGGAIYAAIAKRGQPQPQDVAPGV